MNEAGGSGPRLHSLLPDGSRLMGGVHVVTGGGERHQRSFQLQMHLDSTLLPHFHTITAYFFVNFYQRLEDRAWFPNTNGVNMWRAVTLVELRNRSDTGKANRSPQTTILPAVRYSLVFCFNQLSLKIFTLIHHIM